MNFLNIFAYYTDSDFSMETGASSYSTNSFAQAALFLMFMVLVLIIGLYCVTSFIISRVFKKAGLKSWKAWVPVYRDWVFCELGGYNGAWSIIQVIPIVFVCMFMIATLLFVSSGNMGSLKMLEFINTIGSISSWICPIIMIIISSLSALQISKKVGKPDVGILYPLGVVTLGITTLIWFAKVSKNDTAWNDSLGKPSRAKGTIIGYTIENDTAPTDNTENEVFSPYQAPTETQTDTTVEKDENSEVKELNTTEDNSDTHINQ